MTVFQNLQGLSDHLESNPGIEVVDPGRNLVDWAGELSLGPAWTNQPSIRKVVGFAARNIASVPLHLFERDAADDDRQRIRDGRLADLLRRPTRSPGMTAFRFWEALLIDGLLNDKYVAQLVTHDGYDELVRLPARRVRFENDGLDRISAAFFTRSDGTETKLDLTSLIIDVGYAERGVGGTSPLKTLRHLLDEYTEAVAYRRSIWKNGARVPGIIERPAGTKWEVDARDRFKRSWGAFTRGGGQEGGTPVLEDGMTYKEVNAFRPKDTNDLEGRQLTDIEVASAFHIAPELVGARESTFGNKKVFNQMLFGPALGPYIVAWEQLLNAVLVPLLEPTRDVYVEAAVDAKLRGAFEDQASVLSTSVGAPWMTRNEARSRLNLPALDGGEELITPLNVLIGGQASPQDGKSTEAVLAKFGQRQAQAVRSQKAAGAVDWWDRERWDRELVDDLKAVGVNEHIASAVARQVNDEAEQRFTTEGTP